MARIFSVDSARVYNPAGSSGAPASAIQGIGVTPEFSNSELVGDDKLFAAVSLLKSGKGTIKAGSYSLDAIALMIGRTVSTSVGTGGNREILDFSPSTRFPEFQIRAKSKVANGSVHLLIRRAKVTGGLKLELKNGQWFAHSVDFMVLPDNHSNLWYLVRYPSDIILPSTVPSNTASMYT